jgi:FAD:protein FMN transferase
MISSSRPQPIERARPLLGTRTAIRVSGMGADAAQRAIDAAFAVLAEVQALMSFHDPDSEISRLNRKALYRPVAVHPLTYEVLRLAREISVGSAGAFDVTVAPQLVESGHLPHLESPWTPDPAASWRDVELDSDGCVRFWRPLWVDVGGIAKGYAVDGAIERLREAGAVQACVNAGGDLRVIGPEVERVRLRPDVASDVVPMIALADGSIASSCGYRARQRHVGGWRGPHVDGRSGTPLDPQRFVSVVAQRCVHADALTKPVLALGRDSDPLLRRYGACAYLLTSDGGWQTIGGRE